MKAVDKLTLQYREFFHTGVKDNSHAKDRFPGVRTRVGSRGLQVNKTFVTAIKHQSIFIYANDSSVLIYSKNFKLYPTSGFELGTHIK